ncbi:MAG TPA: GntG family PLP-dependent aldolase [Reyranella sp.]|nr:GntG family PLP-dependent aldolase [Reyranella sp.]
MHDFRSDTVTLPTPAMKAAIATARLGDAARGDDPTVAELERLASALTGKDEALFLPSGTMANLAALIAHDCRGGEVIIEQTAHIYNSEGGGLSVLAGAVPRPIKGARGLLAPDDVEPAIRGAADLALAPTRLICLENTHNAAGGTVMAPASMAAIHAVARRACLPVHLDGARLFNAAAFLDTSIGELCRHVDSVWFALCKGLGGPVGAILAGDVDFMRKARRAARMLGGGMRQAGLLAAPAIVALQDPYCSHRRDNALARRLARGFADLSPELMSGDVQTNIVNCFLDDAADIARALGERGVLALAKGRRIRFVTHAQVDEASVEAAVAALADILSMHRTRRAHA